MSRDALGSCDLDQDPGGRALLEYAAADGRILKASVLTALAMGVSILDWQAQRSHMHADGVQ